MSCRMRPGGAPWSELRRAVRARVPAGSLAPEDALQLCAELIPAISVPYPPPAMLGAENMPSRWPAGRRSRLELCRMIGERYRLRDLGPEEAVPPVRRIAPASHARLGQRHQLASHCRRKCPGFDLSARWPCARHLSLQSHGPSRHHQGCSHLMHLQHPHRLLLPSGLPEPWLCHLHPSY
ncbi:hypothetical protein SEVIR_9G203966v4 [Setaria viridis]|uniref:Uncharacterized protein n=1 Tax=Setaria viridis TaxID=4556 RepID=A0A4U6SYA9_SETVI|nr:hypothetical protein SEVIR_9G203966v2 [Setaria viridis]